MKNKGFEKLFFSKIRDFLDEYLTLTVFRKYVSMQRLSLKTFGFQDCSRDFLLGFMEYLQKEGYEKASCNQRLLSRTLRDFRLL